ncbi:MAG: hypothetical protein JHC93_08410 [Parachlamydiales bacterium]|nr:hypothetical protein [Parachlamydiales bacterium]
MSKKIKDDDFQDWLCMYLDHLKDNNLEAFINLYKPLETRKVFVNNKFLNEHLEKSKTYKSLWLENALKKTKNPLEKSIIKRIGTESYTQQRYSTEILKKFNETTTNKDFQFFFLLLNNLNQLDPKEFGLNIFIKNLENDPENLCNLAETLLVVIEEYEINKITEIYKHADKNLNDLIYILTQVLISHEESLEIGIKLLLRWSEIFNEFQASNKVYTKVLMLISQTDDNILLNMSLNLLSKMPAISKNSTNLQTLIKKLFSDEKHFSLGLAALKIIKKRSLSNREETIKNNFFAAHSLLNSPHQDTWEKGIELIHQNIKLNHNSFNVVETECKKFNKAFRDKKWSYTTTISDYLIEFGFSAFEKKQLVPNLLESLTTQKSYVTLELSWALFNLFPHSQNYNYFHRLHLFICTIDLLYTDHFEKAWDLFFQDLLPKNFSGNEIDLLLGILINPKYHSIQGVFLKTPELASRFAETDLLLKIKNNPEFYDLANSVNILINNYLDYLILNPPEIYPHDKIEMLTDSFLTMRQSITNEIEQMPEPTSTLWQVNYLRLLCGKTVHQNLDEVLKLLFTEDINPDCKFSPKQRYSIYSLLIRAYQFSEDPKKRLKSFNLVKRANQLNLMSTSKDFTFAVYSTTILHLIQDNEVSAVKTLFEYSFADGAWDINDMTLQTGINLYKNYINLLCDNHYRIEFFKDYQSDYAKVHQNFYKLDPKSCFEVLVKLTKAFLNIIVKEKSTDCINFFCNQLKPYSNLSEHLLMGAISLINTCNQRQFISITLVKLCKLIENFVNPTNVGKDFFGPFQGFFDHYLFIYMNIFLSSHSPTLPHRLCSKFSALLCSDTKDLEYFELRQYENLILDLWKKNYVTEDTAVQFIIELCSLYYKSDRRADISHGISLLKKYIDVMLPNHREVCFEHLIEHGLNFDLITSSFSKDTYEIALEIKALQKHFIEQNNKYFNCLSLINFSSLIMNKLMTLNKKAYRSHLNKFLDEDVKMGIYKDFEETLEIARIIINSDNGAEVVNKIIAKHQS